MKVLQHVPAVLLGLVYLIFGANYFFNFIPMPPMQGNAGAFVGLLYSTHFLLVVKIVELICGVLLVANIQRALAAILIAPITINILMFELLIAQMPGVGIVMTLLNAIILYQYRAKYMPIVCGK